MIHVVHTIEQVKITVKSERDSKAFALELREQAIRNSAGQTVTAHIGTVLDQIDIGNDMFRRIDQPVLRGKERTIETSDGIVTA